MNERPNILLFVCDDLRFDGAFAEIWQAAHATAARVAAELPEDCAGPVIPRLSEPWYCCAEPTEQQLQSF